MSYACFICNRSFNAEFSLEQHLNDFHDWESQIDDLNTRFQMCLYCRQSFKDYDSYLQHVLSSCPNIQDSALYWERFWEVLSVMREAVIECFSDQDWKVVSAINDSHYFLPLGIRNAPDNCSPDILIYSRAREEAIIIELNVTWETKMAQANLDSDAEMEFWSQQFEDRGYDCDCYSVEVGVRGLVSNSFNDCFRDLGLNKDRVSLYAQRCADTAIEYSQQIFCGDAESDEDTDD